MLFKKTLLAVAAFAFVGVAAADTTTSSFKVNLTVTKNCRVKTAPIDINLGSVAAGEAVTAGSTVINVNCSKSTPFTVGLTPVNASTTGAGTMTGPGPGTETIPYQLHQTTAAGANWGNVTGTGANVMSGTGSGMGSGQLKPFTAFATVALTATDDVTVGAYTDTVTVTVTY